MTVEITIKSPNEKELVLMNKFIEQAIESFINSTHEPYLQTSLNQQTIICHQLEN